MANDKYQKDFKCPSCGSRGSFWIRAHVPVGVYKGCIMTMSTVNWDDDSYCECPACDKHGTVKDFMNREGD